MQRPPLHYVLAAALAGSCALFGFFRFTHPKKPHHHDARSWALGPLTAAEAADSLAYADSLAAQKSRMP